MAKSRKRIFPKPPVRFHSKLEPELGKHSNKVVPMANITAIYNQSPRIKESKPFSRGQLEMIKRLKGEI